VWSLANGSKRALRISASTAEVGEKVDHVFEPKAGSRPGTYKKLRISALQASRQFSKDRLWGKRGPGLQLQSPAAGACAIIVELIREALPPARRYSGESELLHV